MHANLPTRNTSNRQVMPLSLLLVLTLLLAASLPLGQNWTRPADFPARTDSSSGAALLPVRFTPNAGRTDPSVRFLAQAGAYALAFRAGGVDAYFAGSVERAADLRLRFVGAQPAPTIEGLDLQPGVVSHLHGNDPMAWHTGLPTYASLAYRGLYPGIDLVYRSAGRNLKSEFIVAAGADPGRIALRYEGAQRVEVAPDGALSVVAASGELREAAPVASQEIGGRHVSVAAAWVVTTDGRVRFRLGAYDPMHPLVIDPTLVYSTYLGGSDGDPWREYVNDIAVDKDGNMFVTGFTPATDFPTANPVQTDQPGFDAFVAKISADGQTLLYASYLGGAGQDEGNGIAVDANGTAYLVGDTASADFPTLHPYQGDQAGRDAWVAKLSPAGQLIYATYLGAANVDAGHDIAVDDQGHAFVTGVTGSLGFPTQNPLMGPKFAFNGASTDAFVTEFSADGQTLLFSTYLGGTNTENNEGRGGIDVDGDGSILVAGTTRSQNFPVANAYQNAFGGGTTDAFLTRINAAGSALDFSTYLGGSGTEEGRGVAADRQGNVYMAGETGSSDFPTANPLQPDYGGFISDAFVAKFTSNGGVVYATYLGGSNSDAGNAIAVNDAGEAYVTGCASSGDFPIVYPLQPISGIIGCAVFVTRLSSNGATLRYSTLLGGGEGRSVAWSRGYAYVGGEAGPRFLLKRPSKATPQGRGEAFVSQIDDLNYLYLPMLAHH